MTLAIHGGAPVRYARFPARSTYGPEEVAAAIEVVRSGMLSDFRGSPGERFNGGKYVRAFEDVWTEMYGYPHVVTVNSWTTGLVACLSSVGVGRGDEVIVPAWTMSATATAALLLGARPVFADVEPDTFCLDPDSVVEIMGSRQHRGRIRAVIAVHLFGQPANMAQLRAVCGRSAVLIEDCAQSPGVRYHGQHVGAIGDVGGFSLTQTKHVHTGEGGVIVTEDSGLAERCRQYRNHGENVPGGAFGGNFRLTELQAALGICQMAKLPGVVRARQRLATRLSGRLGGLPGIQPPHVREGSEHAYFTYAIRYDAEELGLPRETFVRAVNAELGDRVLVAGYVEPLHRNPVYESGASLPVVERLQDTEVVLCRMVRDPLTEADMDDVADAVEKVLGNVDELRRVA